LDAVPTDQIGVGSIVLFPQGSYGGTEGNNTGGQRYHQGKITKVYTDNDGITRLEKNAFLPRINLSFVSIF